MCAWAAAAWGLEEGRSAHTHAVKAPTRSNRSCGQSQSTRAVQSVPPRVVIARARSRKPRSRKILDAVTPPQRKTKENLGRGQGKSWAWSRKILDAVKENLGRGPSFAPRDHGRRGGRDGQGSGAGPRNDRLGEAIEHLRLRPGRRRGRPASGLRQAGTRLNGNAGRVAPVAGTRGSWGRRR